MSGDLNVELLARMPWLAADADSIWNVTGVYGPGKGTFTNCLARVLPPFVTGSDEPLFEILLYGGPTHVPASAITSARELLLVMADEPWRAYYDEDQASIDAAIRRSRT